MLALMMNFEYCTLMLNVFLLVVMREIGSEKVQMLVYL